MLVPAGVPVTVGTASNSPSLSVGLTIFDVSGVSPVLVSGPTLMANLVGNSYFGKFTPLNAKQYIAFIAVYTDGTLMTIDPAYEQQVQSFEAMNWLPSVSDVVGMVDCGDQVFPSPVFKIFLDDHSTMFFRVVDKAFNPIDLSSCSEIVVNLANADGTYKQLKKSTGDVAITSPAVLGKFYAPILSGVSLLLNVGELQDVDVTFTISGQTFTVPFKQALSVFEVT